MLLSIHQMAAAFTGAAELELDPDEAEKLAYSAGRVARHYHVPKIAEKAMDWTALLMALGTIYGTRALAIRLRYQAEAQEAKGRGDRARVANPPPAQPAQPPVQQPVAPASGPIAPAPQQPVGASMMHPQPAGQGMQPNGATAHRHTIPPQAPFDPDAVIMAMGAHDKRRTVPMN